MKFCPNFVLQVTNTGRELEAKLSGLDVYFQQLARCFVFVLQVGSSGALFGLLAVLLVEVLQGWKWVKRPCVELVKIVVLVVLLLGKVTLHLSYSGTVSFRDQYVTHSRSGTETVHMLLRNLCLSTFCLCAPRCAIHLLFHINNRA